MIQANELRIGNIVFHVGHWMRVRLFTERTVTGVTAHSKVRSVTHRGIKGLDVDPIPLNEEVLFKCGLKLKQVTENVMAYVREDRDETYIGNRERGGFFLGYIEFDRIDNSYLGECSAPIHYLHQLQNLWFSITGQELEISL